MMISKRADKKVEHVEASLWSRLLALPNSRDMHKDEALQMLWGLKQLTAIALGTACGISLITGWHGFVAYGLMQFLLTYWWTNRHGLLGVYLEVSDLLTESTPLGMGMFAFCWTLTYTIFLPVLGNAK